MTRDHGVGSSDDARAADRYRHLIEHVQDAVVEFEFVDGVPIVREVNRAFVDIFGYALDEIRGESLNEWVVPGWNREDAAALDANTASGEINYQQVTRETTSGLREFLYRGIPYEGRGQRDGGFAVYTDLTEVSRNERRLKVLNRILRHNLRNNANVVAGHTSQLLTQIPEQSAEATDAAATIERAARELEQLAEEAGHIRKVLQQRTDEDADIDPKALIRSVVGDRRQRSPSVVFDVDLTAAEPVIADSHLRYAVESLVDNAIEHNPSPSPRVRVRIDRSAGSNERDSDDWLVIHIEDDGPEIPPHERDVIRDGAEITPTYHGSGLGLWLAELTVETFGGELSFDTSELGGNDVSIRLRRSDRERN